MRKRSLAFSPSTLPSLFMLNLRDKIWRGPYPLKYKFKKSLPDKFSLLRHFYCLYCQEVRAVGICKISQRVSWHHMWKPKWALMQMEKRNKKRQTRLSQCVGGAQSKHRFLSCRSGILLEYYFWKLAVFAFEKNCNTHFQLKKIVSTAKVNQYANVSIL